jgi:hypothetical protein
MKKLFLTSISALLLATGAAHADKLPHEQYDMQKHWQGDWRRCWAIKNFSSIDPNRNEVFGENEEVWFKGKNDIAVTLSLEDVLELQKQLPLLKRCTAFYQCVADREEGKVKHCYANDRRWR